METTSTPTRPALKYYGGKWLLAPWIISHFPPHLHYIEPYMGAASVLLQKPISKLETLNDLDGSVVNFFRVLRDSPDELIRRIRLTPWARDEYNLCKQETKVADPIEWARRFYVGCWQSISGGPKPGKSGWQVKRDMALTHNVTGNKHRNHIQSIVDRLIDVQIESKDALELIKVSDTSDNLFYIDPPYLDTERASSQYTHDFIGIDPHATLATLLRTCTGFVIVSGYACPLYAELYENHGWHRVDKEAQTNGAARIESLWLSPRTWAAVEKREAKQMEMF